MKTYGPKDPRLSGKVNSNTYVAYYPHLNCSIIKKKPKKRNPDDWSPKQKASHQRYLCMHQLASKNLDTIIRPIWNKHKEAGPNGYNNFISENKQAFDYKGELAYPMHIKVSSGSLPLPPDLNIERNADSSSIIIKWTKDLKLSEERDSDRLYYALLNENKGIDMYDCNSSRANNTAQVCINNTDKMPDTIYLFFASKKSDMFSCSQAFNLI